MDSYHNTEQSIKCLCALLDWPYIASLYYGNLNDDGTFDLASYHRQLQMKQYQDRNFATSFVDGELGKDVEAIRDWRATK